MKIFRRPLLYFSLVLTIFSAKPAVAQNFDINLLKAINPQDPTANYWVQTSASAYWVSGIAIVGSLGYGFIAGDKNMQHNAYELVLNIAISTGISQLLKVTINRERPADRYPNDIFVNGPVHGQSFPSGHTTLAFATATTLALDYKRWYFVVPAYLWAGTVGYSRMYLGKHYPSDVLAGAIIGIGTGYFSHWLRKKLFTEKQSAHKQPA
jgi:membrane-associated phospholipid phosphatase